MYSTCEYWDSRYALDDGTEEWLHSYDALKAFLYPIVRASGEYEVLVAGCGNSELSARLYHDGVCNISNIDFSNVVVQQMADRYEALSEMDYSCLDVRDMDKYMRPESFDLVIDKALLDCLVCDDVGVPAAKTYIASVYSSLKPGGCYFLVTHGSADARLPLLQAPDRAWTIDCHSLPREGPDTPSGENSVFVLTKPRGR